MLTNENNGLKGRLRLDNVAREDLESIISKCNNQIESLTEENTALQNVIFSLKETISIKVFDNQNNTVEIDRLKSRLSELELIEENYINQRQELLNEANSLRVELETSRQEFESYKSSIINTNIDQDKIESEFNTRLEEVQSRLKEVLEELSIEKRKSEDILSESIKEKEELKLKALNIYKRCKSLEDQINDHEKDLSDKVNTINQRDSELSELYD
eukprot:gene601-835_t